MNRTNRIEPVNIDIHPAKYAVMTISTQMEFLRHIEITPINEEITQQHPYLRPTITKRSRKTLSLVTCLFTTAAIITLSIFVIGVIISSAKAKVHREDDIEKYDLGDLQYGLNNINQMTIPSHTYLSDINTILVQKYFSDRLLNVSGYRGLVIDRVILQNQLLKNQRKQRDTSCSILFIIQNLQIYFDQCSGCTKEHQRALHHSFFNLTTFQQPLHLIINNFNTYPQICSIPYPLHSIIPNRLNYSNVSSVQYKPTSTQKPFIINTTNLMRESERKTKSKLSNTKTTTTTLRAVVPTSSSTKKPIVHHRQSTIPNTFQFLPFQPSSSYFSKHNTIIKHHSDNS